MTTGKPSDHPTNPAAPRTDREFQVWNDGRAQGYREAERTQQEPHDHLRTQLAAVEAARDTYKAAFTEADNRLTEVCMERDTRLHVFERALVCILAGSGDLRELKYHQMAVQGGCRHHEACAGPERCQHIPPEVCLLRTRE